MKKEIPPQLEAVEKAILTERTIKQYMDYLDITEEDLKKWDTIVDLGSGTEQEFSNGIKEKGLKNVVISIDPKLGLPEDVDLEGVFPEEKEARLRGRKKAEKNTIAGLAQQLPIKDESVDALVSLHSVPQYINEKEELFNVFIEVVRVLKEGAEARFFPILKNKNLQVVKEILDKIDEIKYRLILKESVGDEYKYLLVIKKHSE